MNMERKLECKDVRYVLYIMDRESFPGHDIKLWLKDHAGFSVWSSLAVGRKFFYDKPIINKRFLREHGIARPSLPAEIKVVKVTVSRYTITNTITNTITKG